MPTIRTVFRSLRASQPFNRLVTTAIRGGFGISGLSSEFVTNKMRRVGLVEHCLPNGRMLRLWTEDDDLIPNVVFWRGWDGFEPETVTPFFRLASRARITLDVGAHIGLLTLLAAHANPKGRVYAFEPMPATYRRLRRNVALNGLTNVECVASAAGEFEGTADLFYNTGVPLPGESSLRRECTESFKTFCPIGEIRHLRVPVMALDGFVRQQGLSNVDLVKLDTEGTEPEVLRGMQETLRRDHPILICEVLKGFGTEQRLEDLLAPIGYRYYLLSREGPILRDRIEGQPDGRWELRNYLFTTLPHQEMSDACRDQ
jgi:FkbM family methyltransferase